MEYKTIAVNYKVPVTMEPPKFQPGQVVVIREPDDNIDDIFDRKEVVISAPVMSYSLENDFYGWVYLFERRPAEPEVEQVAESTILSLNEYRTLLQEAVNEGDLTLKEVSHAVIDYSCTATSYQLACIRLSMKNRGLIAPIESLQLCREYFDCVD